MSAALRKVGYFALSQDIKETFWEKGVLIADSVPRQIAERTLFQCLGSLIGNGTVSAARKIYSVRGIAEKILTGDFRSIFKKFYDSQQKLKKSITLLLYTHPGDLAASHMKYYVEDGVVHTVCDFLETATQSSLGKMIYVAVSPASISPLTSASVWMAVNLAAMTVASPGLNTIQEEEGVELDDFKMTDEWEKVDPTEIDEEEWVSV